MAVIRSLCLARERKGLTQQQVADAIGITRQALAAWENGVNLPTIENLFSWATAVGVVLEARDASICARG